MSSITLGLIPDGLKNRMNTWTQKAAPWSSKVLDRGGSFGEVEGSTLKVKIDLSSINAG